MSNANNIVKSPAPAVPALEKALDILEYVAQHGTPITVKQIAITLELPLATTYRIVKYLCNRGYLRGETEGEYSLGPQFLYLTQVVTGQFDLISQAKPIMNALAAQTGQTAQLGILQDSGVVYIEQAFPSRPVNIVAALHTVIPVNLSASGKVLVAYLNPQEQAYFLQSAPLVMQTRRSIVDRETFQAELLAVRQQGYALDQEEYARGIGCAAAPIWDYRNQVIAAIGITGHIKDYNDPQDLAQVVGRVTDAAQAISRRIGARAEDGDAASS